MCKENLYLMEKLRVGLVDSCLYLSGFYLLTVLRQISSCQYLLLFSPKHGRQPCPCVVRAIYKCLRIIDFPSQQPSPNDGWDLLYRYPSPLALQVGNFGLCVSYHFPQFSHGIMLQSLSVWLLAR